MDSRRVPLRSYPDLARAEHDVMFLREQGIAAQVADEQAMLAGGRVATLRGQVVVEVAFDDREHAMVLLETRRRAIAAREEEEDARCPRCASEDIGTYYPFAIWVLLPLLLPFLVIMLVLIPFIPFAFGLLRRRHHYCAACGNRWRAQPRDRSA